MLPRLSSSSDNLSSESQIHNCEYLRYFWEVKKATGLEILDISVEMTNWLSQNSIKHVWSKNVQSIQLDGNIHSGFTLPFRLLEFSTSIQFNNEEDLLAFKPRWGICATQ